MCPQIKKVVLQRKYLKHVTSPAAGAESLTRDSGKWRFPGKGEINLEFLEERNLTLSQR